MRAPSWSEIEFSAFRRSSFATLARNLPNVGSAENASLAPTAQWCPHGSAIAVLIAKRYATTRRSAHAVITVLPPPE